MDYAVFDVIRKRWAADAGLVDTFMDAFDERRRDTWSWCDFKPDPSGNANIVGYSTGWGEPGMYASYWGFDDRDRLVGLVTDFNTGSWFASEPFLKNP